MTSTLSLAPFSLYTSVFSLGVTIPFSVLTAYKVVFLTILFTSFKYSTLSLAPILTIVGCASTTTGFPRCAMASPVVAFTVYVVVTVLEPSRPSIVTFGVSFSRLSSFS